MRKMSSVLVVENDDGFRACVREVLEQLGCRVIEASNADSAREELDTYLPDLVILDVRLENDDDPFDRSGLKLLRKLPRYLPVIVLTRHEDAHAVRDAFQAAPDAPTPQALLFKDEGSEAIRAHVNEILKSSRPTAQPWYREKSFLILAGVATTLFVGGGIYVAFLNQGGEIMGVIVIGVLIEVMAAIVVHFFNLTD